MTTATDQDIHALLRLMAWLSPSFPVGSFGYSHGLEQAIADGFVGDGDTLFDWVSFLLTQGSAWNDGVLFAEAHRAAADAQALIGLADLARALATSAERLAETRDQGLAFEDAVGDWLGDRASRTSGFPYPVAVGRHCGRAGLPVTASLAAYLHAFAANLVVIAVRAVPLGQSVGVKVLARLEPVILATAERAAAASLEDLGGAAMGSDIAAMRHETLETRLFIS